MKIFDLTIDGIQMYDGRFRLTSLTSFMQQIQWTLLQTNIKFKRFSVLKKVHCKYKIQS